MLNWEFRDQDSKDYTALRTRFESALEAGTTEYFGDDEFEVLIDHYQETGQFQFALQAAEMAIVINPYHAVFLVRKAESLFELHRAAEALECLDLAFVLDPSDPEMYLLRADIYIKRGDSKEALKLLEKAFELTDATEHPLLLVEISEIHEKNEAYDQAFDSLSRALKINAFCQEALARIWFVTDLLENYEQAASLHEHVVSENPYSVMGWYNLGKARQGMHRYMEAIDAFEYAEAIDEHFLRVWRDIGECWFQQGEYRRAIDSFNKLSGSLEMQEEVFFPQSTV